MNFGVFYDLTTELMRGGFWEDQRPGSVVGAITDQKGQKHTVFFTEHHYGMLNSETRIVSYIGMARKQIPSTHYSRLDRTLVTYRPHSMMDIVPS